MGAHDRRIDHLHEVRSAAHVGQNGEHRLENALWLSRQNRFQMLFHLPNSAGKARHVML